MKIHIIVAALPPKLDGIGDYTALLSAELAKSVTVKILTGREQTPDPVTGVEIVPAFTVNDPKSYWDILPLIEAEKPDWVLLQYNPFSYGRRGLNLHLPAVIRRMKRNYPQIRFALMVHEPFVPVLDVKHAVMTTWQRWQLWSLGRCADIVFFSIDPWAQKYRSWFPNTPVLHLPISSNMPLISVNRNDIRVRLGIPNEKLVVGLFGTAHNATLLERIYDAVQMLQKADHDPLILYIGPHEGRVRAVLGSVPLCTTGVLSASEVSIHLQAFDISLVPYVDGISTRRTTLMAALQHGLAVVGTDGYHTDQILRDENGRSFLLADARSQSEFSNVVLRLANDPVLRANLGLVGQQCYEQNFSRNHVTQRMLVAMASVQKKLQIPVVS